MWNIGQKRKQSFTPKGESVFYLPMSLERHDPGQVASLIYESAPAMFSLMFGSQANSHLESLVQRSNNRFSYQYICVAEIEHQVVGIAVLIPSRKIHLDSDYCQVLKFNQRLWLRLVQRFILSANL